MASWRAKARTVLLGLRDKVDMADLPAARKTIKEAYPFGERAYTPYKVWCEEVRKCFPGLYPSRKPEPSGGLFDGAPEVPHA